ncbi:UNVERIFIED_CONTAM: 60S ribosomal export protein NMD3 [Sesamum calycinum]|uniref:60S ribosomal export protein NMD3 n=1 Tax=Sesamum calycinum TaxID=2727403 RepID=A0AAW2Q555_9LAMI
MFTVPQTIGSVLCCKCGILMQPNAANMCAKCLRSEVDITEGLQKHVIIIHCPECDTYLQPPRTWIKAQLESKELLTFCVKRLKNLNKVRLVHAEFIWTEPHSKRIKVKLRVQKEVLNGAILEQAYTVDMLCKIRCVSLARGSKRILISGLLQCNCGSMFLTDTFFYLEQLILKHDAAKYAIRIKQMDQGVDFFFSNRSHGVKFVEFLGKVTPIRSRNDKQLVSHDPKSNNYNYKYTFSVEISPICREDLICLPPKLAVSLGNFGPLVICNKVTNSIALLDPFTLRQSFLDAEQYWRSSFKALLSTDAQVARVSDFGKNDTIFNVRTHMGHILNPGDYALGYDLYGANNNDIELDKYKGLVLPDVILIKKSYEEKRQKRRGKPRSWKLKSLNMEIDNTARGKDNEEKMNSEYEQFLRDLEENPDLRFNLSLYRNKEYQPSEMASITDGEDVPSVPLDELLADLDLSDEEEDGEDDNDSMKE